ncbi:MAG: NAD-dependent epimerase/dehydratase family protein, partial [Ferruginibacter sp.]|nr:NAD-dependent epimerase/dehydratase family protein [Ferruginibacter sp.]
MSTENNNKDNNDSVRVLVTGAAGLIGNELVHQLLRNGVTVKALYHRTPLKNFDSRLLQIQQCDLLDVFEVEDAIKDVSHIFHCAGLVSFSPGQRDELY